ncbi:hypothetical protein TNCV_415261 [Trichonephila clavipes]|nr:hypothetical protein TNCV_415261 [Trichonephila clavipes]
MEINLKPGAGHPAQFNVKHQGLINVKGKRNEPPRRPKMYTTVVCQPKHPVKTLPDPWQSDVYRTDNRPFFFHCGRPGHVFRYCHERRGIFDEYRSRQATNIQLPSLNLSRDECRWRGKTEIWIVNGQSYEKFISQGKEPFCPDCIATISKP